MKSLGKIISTIVVIALILYGIYFAGSQGWLNNTPLKDLNYEQFNLLRQENLDQTKVLSDRAKETSEHVQQILGEQVEVDQTTKEKALHEKTIEYARYLYCKQVVESWDQNQIKNKLVE